MTCHHTDDDLPAFLCRRCHPEMNITPERKAVLDAADAAKRAAQSAADTKARELRRAESKLASLTRNGEPAEGSVSAKIAASIRRKIEKLSA